MAADLKDAQSLVAKLQKENPSEGLKASCLEEITAAYRRAMTARRDRSAKGRDAAEERRARRAEIVAKLRDELQSFAEALEELEDCVQDEYSELAQNLEQFDEQVLEEIQKKVGVEGIPVSLDKPADPVLERHRQETAEGLKRLAAAAKEADKRAKEAEERAKEADLKAKAAQEEAEELKERLEQRAEGAPAAHSDGSMSVDAEAEAEQNALYTELDPDLLPTLPAEKIVAAGIPVLSRAWNILQQVRWAVNTPVTLTDLGIGGDDLKLLIGEQWSAVYSIDPPQEANVDPQILRLLAFALEKMDAKFAELGEEERKTAKQDAKEALEAMAKRRRTAKSQKVKKDAKKAQ